jgi:hypothetical protein
MTKISKKFHVLTPLKSTLNHNQGAQKECHITNDSNSQNSTMFFFVVLIQFKITNEFYNLQ